MSLLRGKTVFLAGNGPSLEALEPGHVLQSDKIVRVNNFVFERRAHTGLRVDLAVFGGDPRLAGFAARTLKRKGTDYQIAAWTSHNPKVRAQTARYFPHSFEAWQLARHPMGQEVERCIAAFGRKPLTGTYALLEIIARGAENIVMAGMDFYSTARRYAYPLGRYHQAALGAHAKIPGLDQTQHDMALERALMEIALQFCPGTIRAINCPGAAQMGLAEAKARKGPAITPPMRKAPKDFVAHDGRLPLAALVAYRAMRRAVKRDL